MQGRFSALINIASFGYGAGIFFLSIHYFLGTIGTTSTRWKTVSCKEGAQSPKEYLGEERCKALMFQIEAGGIALLAGAVQMTICVLALATKYINWLVWMISHAVVFLLSLTSTALVFAAFSAFRSYSKSHKKDCQTDDRLPKKCSYFPGHYSLSIGDPRSLNTVVCVYGVILLLNALFCAGGAFLMFWKRKDTLPGGAAVAVSKGANPRNKQLQQTQSKKPIDKDAQSDSPLLYNE
jgi:hypothetical protein